MSQAVKAPNAHPCRPTHLCLPTPPPPHPRPPARPAGRHCSGPRRGSACTTARRSARAAAAAGRPGSGGSHSTGRRTPGIGRGPDAATERIHVRGRLRQKCNGGMCYTTGCFPPLRGVQPQKLPPPQITTPQKIKL